LFMPLNCAYVVAAGSLLKIVKNTVYVHMIPCNVTGLALCLTIQV
jgi:hypothetical protein